MNQNRIAYYAFAFQRGLKLKQNRKEELQHFKKQKLRDLILNYDVEGKYKYTKLDSSDKSQLIDIVMEIEMLKFYVEVLVKEFIVEVGKEYGENDNQIKTDDCS